MGRNSDSTPHTPGVAAHPGSAGKSFIGGEAGSIERLIDDGLRRYRAGDLSGAIVAWERVLAMEPAHPQATSYVGYVRLNYGVLEGFTGPALAMDSAAPYAQFGMDDHPEYVIESSAVRAVPIVPDSVRVAPVLDSFRDDWLIEEDVAADALQRSRTRSLELSLQLALDEEDSLSAAPEVLNFESLTTEYTGTRGAPSPAAGGFGAGLADSTPVGRPTRPPQLEVRVRSPSVPAVKSRSTDPNALRAGLEMTDLEIGEVLDNVTERQTVDMPPLRDARTTAGEDLIASLPIPRRVGADRGAATAGPGVGGRSTVSQADTWRPSGAEKSPTSPPGAHSPAAAVAVPPAVPAIDPTPHSRPGSAAHPGTAGVIDDLILDLSDSAVDDRAPDSTTVPVVATRGDSVAPPVSEPDFDLAPSPDVTPGGIEPRISSGPTVELPKFSVPAYDDDLPTRQSARAASADALSRALAPARPSGAPMSPFQPRVDPINARSAQILDEIDADGGRIDEPRDERIRRRITALVARAGEWSQSDPEKAVCAVELAMSEDPNSALAQKLIHRHRETIMNVFQTYVGNLEHKPQLERPLHELNSTSITPRAAFLLSRVDGQLTLDEILDVSGMPRQEAYRHLCQLFLHKVLS